GRSTTGSRGWPTWGGSEGRGDRGHDEQDRVYGGRNVQERRSCARLPALLRARATGAGGAHVRVQLGGPIGLNAATKSWRRKTGRFWTSGSRVGATSSTSRCIMSSARKRPPRE